MKRYFIIVDGRVQGVGFRYFCQNTAVKNSLTGWVRNLSNGMVEMEVQGLEKDIRNFLSIIQKGNNFIRIDHMSMKAIDIVPSEKKFRVEY